MSALTVHFPHRLPGWTMSKLRLKAVPGGEPLQGRSKPPTDAEVAVDFPYNDHGCDAPVFSASAIRGFGPENDNGRLRLALKFAFRDDFLDDLVDEARVYTFFLKSIQGKSVPRCYGLYSAELEDGQTIGCLVLENCGECLQQEFEVLHSDAKLEILDRLRDIHNCGLHHEDFAERNVLSLDGEIRIIDFDQMSSHEDECVWTEPTVGDRMPDIDDFGCPWLWTICVEMGIWDDTDSSDGSDLLMSPSDSS